MPKKAVIAIVDDDESVREALTSLIRSLGYAAVAFGCAEDLLKSRHRERALESGVICYLTKPFSEDDLLACIRSTLAPSAAAGQGS